MLYIIASYVVYYSKLCCILYRGGSGAPAGTVWAGPLFEFLTLLLAINHYKTTNLLPSKKPEQHLSNTVYIDHHINHKYATLVHVILREASFPVGLVAACRWPIVTATVLILQNWVSVGL